MLKLLFLISLMISHPVHCQDEDPDLKELEAIQQKRAEQVEKIKRTTEIMANPLGNPFEEIQKLGYSQLNSAAMMNKKVRDQVLRAFKEAQMNKESPETLKLMVMTKVSGTFLATLFTYCPVLLDVSVDVLKSEDALPSLLGIFDKKKELQTYFFIWLGAFFFLTIMKKILFYKKTKKKKTISLYSWIFGNFLFSFTLSTIGFAVFYFMFQQEVGPLVKILVQRFF